MLRPSVPSANLRSASTTRAPVTRTSVARPPLTRAAALIAGLTFGASAVFAQAAPRAGVLGGTGTPPRSPTPTPRQPTTPAAPAAAPVPTGGHATPISGIVYDSLSDAPLARATVQFVSPANPTQAYSTETDSLGHYRLPAVQPGRYVAGFMHPDLDALGIELRPQVVDLYPDSAAHFDFAVPGSRTLLPALCGENAPAGRGATTSADENLLVLLQPKAPGALTGSVRDAESGGAVPGAKVVVTWKELKSVGGALQNASRRWPATVRADGGFIACGLPADVDLVVSAEAKGRHAGLVDVRLSAGRLSRRDFVLGDTSSATIVTLPDTAAVREGRLAVPLTVARGKARLNGVVRTPDGRPVSGATVLVQGTDVTGRTSETGSFTLTGLPAGTYSAEVRAIGYAPKRVAVNLSSTRVASVAIPLDKSAPQLQGVVVRAERTKLEKDYTGFLDRVKHGQGHYITEEQLTLRQAIQFTDVMRMMPGMHVVPNGQMGYAVQGRGNCTPDVYLDGMPIIDGATSLNDLVNPNDVSGVEVYNGGATTPLQFQTGGGSGGSCGVVVVWTKRGKPASSSTTSSASPR